MMRFYVIHIALIVIVYLHNGRIWGSADSLNPTCNTTECHRLGKYYLQNIDTLGQPCNDFYDYVCSNWGVHNPRPKELSIQNLWNVEQSLESRSLQEMRKLLESKIPSKSSEFERAKLLYKTCMFTSYMGRSSPSDVWNVMKKTASFPNTFSKNAVPSERPFFWEIEEHYIQTAGESALFDFYPFYDSTTNEIITNLQYLSSPYGSLMRPVNWTSSNELEHYKSFLTNVVRSIVEPRINISMDDINAVIQFREDLNMIIAKYAPNNQGNVMAIYKFQSLYLNGKPNTYVDWLSVISAMYTNSNNVRKLNITKLSTIRVHIPYFMELLALLTRTSGRTIAYHIHLYFAENHVELTSQMKHNLLGSVALTELRGTITSDKPRWRKCIETNNLRAAMGKAYVSSFFPPAQKANVVELFETTKKLMATQILQSSWLDKQTKDMSINKLADIKGSLGYPDWYDATAPTKPTSPEMDPVLPIIFYMRELNQIVSSAAALQWPIYSPNVPYVIDYGSLGARFGYELHHAFNGEGITKSAKGESPWWSKKMILKYFMNTICFVKWFREYKEHEFWELTKNLAPTTRNDIANAMGLKLAYIAFKEMVKKKNGVCPVLPGFEGVGCEKLFFIAFASSQCSASLPGYNELVWFKDGQSFPNVQINGAVANMKEFSAAFGCRPKAPLYAEQTCDIWRP